MNFIYNFWSPVDLELWVITTRLFSKSYPFSVSKEEEKELIVQRHDSLSVISHSDNIVSLTENPGCLFKSDRIQKKETKEQTMNEGRTCRTGRTYIETP